MYTYKYTRMYTYMRMCVCVNVHVFECVYIYKYAYAHMYTDIFRYRIIHVSICRYLWIQESKRFYRMLWTELPFLVHLHMKISEIVG